MFSCISEDLPVSQEERQAIEVENSEESVKGNMPSANGHGTLRYEDALTRHFTFHANTMPDGSVDGSGVLRRSNEILEFKFDIDCLTLFDNTAVMMGIVRSSESHPSSVGNGFWFKVIDNGEGSSAVDQISFFYPNRSNPDWCGINFSFVPVFDIDGGDIQVMN